jgi:hypothetical protein
VLFVARDFVVKYIDSIALDLFAAYRATFRQGNRAPCKKQADYQAGEIETVPPPGAHSSAIGMPARYCHGFESMAVAL